MSPTKTIIAIVITTLTRTSIPAQSTTQLAQKPVINQPTEIKDKRAFKIGDPVQPDIVFEKMLNYSKSSASISEFKGKLVILDFWGTFCVSCIEAFPHIEALQKQFAGKVQIILVNTKNTHDDIQKVKRCFQRLEKLNGLKVTLPCAVEDDITDIRFPRALYPHYVWINEKGIVCQVTSAEYVTADNISKMLAGDNVQFPEKNDRMDIDFAKPIISDASSSNMKYHSVLSGYTEGLSGSLGTHSAKNGLADKIFGTNVSILHLYKYAYTEAYNFARNRVILDVADKEKYDYSKNPDWKFNNAYCYELIVPPTSKSHLHQMMQEDLKRYFGLEAKIEKRIVPCLVLKTIGDTRNAATKGSQPDNNLREQTFKGKHLYNCPIAVLLDYMNNSVSPTPIIDESHFTSNVDMELPEDLSDIDGLKKVLNSYGFDLVAEKREIPVFILKENINSSNGSEINLKGF